MGSAYNWVENGLALAKRIGAINAPTIDGSVLPFNVKDFGAKGDGVTDDTLAVQSAVNAAGAYLAGFARGQGHAIVDLSCGQYLISAPIVWPVYNGTQSPGDGLTLQNGTLKAMPAFPNGRFLVEMQPSIGGLVGVMLASLRYLTLDCQRIAGVGGLLLQAHQETLVFRCYIKRANTYGIRSIAGGSTSDLMMISHCYIDEWPAVEDGNTGAVTSIALSIEHNDSVAYDNIIGIASQGIICGGQDIVIHGGHIFTGYRQGGVPSDVVTSDGIVITYAVCQVIGVVFDSCRLHATNPSGLIIRDNIFLHNTGDVTAVHCMLDCTAPNSVMQNNQVTGNMFYNINGTVTTAFGQSNGVGYWSQYYFRTTFRDNNYIAPCAIVTGPFANAAGATWVPGAVDVGTRSDVMLAAGSNNNYDAGYVEQLRVTPTAPGSTLTGIVNGFQGRRLKIINVAAIPLTIAHNAVSTSYNRFYCSSQNNVVLAQYGFVDCEFDAWSGQWKTTGRGAGLASAPVVIIVDGVGPVPDCSLGNAFVITVGAARVFNVPLNPTNGQRISITIIQGGAGAFAITWNAVYKQSWLDAGNLAGKRSTIAFVYDGANWNQEAVQSVYV